MAIKISQKDKSLILFIITVFVVLWFAFSFLTNLIFSSAFFKSDASKIISLYDDEEQRWLNLARKLEKKDLKSRIILLDFWTHSCVNCLHAIPEIKQLEKEFGNKILVIGVHSGKFENEKDIESIRKAVLRYKIHHPVINDSMLKIWNEFEINARPTFVLIDPRGRVKETYIGENDIKYARKDIKKLVEKYRYHLNRDELPILLEKNKIIKTVLNYPTKISYSKNFAYKSYSGPAFFVANSARNSVIVAKENGEIITQIGLKDSGLQDGIFDVARFNFPSGILYSDGVLYVADTQNHALRAINFKSGRVETLIGNKEMGQVLKGETDALNFSLALPLDLEFFGDKNKIAIANSGTNQILLFDVKTKKIKPLAGSGIEGNVDGKFPKNSLAQTSSLSFYDDKLYFIDSSTSSLRVYEKDGNVRTLIGNNISDFGGHKNGDKKTALMQHPLDLFVNKNGIYISDSFNHKIRKYQFNSKEIKDLFGDKRGNSIGEDAEFDEPDGVVVVDNNMFVVDANNNRIVKINFDKMKSSLLNVMPPLQLPHEGFLQYLPNLNVVKKALVKSEGVEIKINFAEESYKINEKGPSFINLLELVSENKANLIKTFDWNLIKNDEIKLPDLQKNKKYILQGTIYFCEDKINALCFIASYEQEIEVVNDGEKIIKIEL